MPQDSNNQITSAYSGMFPESSQAQGAPAQISQSTEASKEDQSNNTNDLSQSRYVSMMPGADSSYKGAPKPSEDFWSSAANASANFVNKNYPELGAAGGIGLAMKAGVPQGLKYNPEEWNKNKEKYEQNHNTLNLIEQNKNDLLNEHDRLSDLHNQNVANHERAILEHANAKTTTFEDFMPESYQPERELTGGEAWAKNWANQERPGIGGVPEASAAYNRSKYTGKVSSRISKNYGPKGPDEPNSLLERLAARRVAAEERAKTDAEFAEQKRQAEIDRAEHVAQKEAAEKQASLARKESAAQLQQIKRNLNPTASDIKSEQSLHNENQTILENLAKQVTPWGSLNPSKLSTELAKIGRSTFPRFTPGIGATFAPFEAEKTIEDYKAGNYGRMLAHGAGTVGALAQATDIPLLMGAGDVLQLPSIFLGGYDLGNAAKDYIKSKESNSPLKNPQ
jgi:hypothetical protein